MNAARRPARTPVPALPAAAPRPWAVRLPGTAVNLRFEPADPARHAPMLRRWLHEPHVRPWWGSACDGPTAGYLAEQWDTGYLVPWVVAADGEPFGYVETYRAAEDPLARVYPLSASDRGWHVLVGPPRLLGTGTPRLLGRAVLARLLAKPGVDRVVCEPDERNARVLAFCRALGHERLAVVDLPDKRAVLLACTRDGFAARWPGDVEAAARAADQPSSRGGGGR